PIPLRVNAARSAAARSPPRSRPSRDPSSPHRRRRRGRATKRPPSSWTGPGRAWPDRSSPLPAPSGRAASPAAWPCRGSPSNLRSLVADQSLPLPSRLLLCGLLETERETDDPVLDRGGRERLGQCERLGVVAHQVAGARERRAERAPDDPRHLLRLAHERLRQLHRLQRAAIGTLEPRSRVTFDVAREVLP